MSHEAKPAQAVRYNGGRSPIVNLTPTITPAPLSSSSSSSSIVSFLLSLADALIERIILSALRIINVKSVLLYFPIQQGGFIEKGLNIR